MENKINIAEILKNCEKGMELDCILFKDTPAYFHGVITETNYPIEIKVEYPSKELETFFLNKYGAIYDRPTAKCVIFPKGKTTWEGFVPPCKFKDGDRVVKKGDISTPVLIVRVGDKYYYHYSNTEGTIGLLPIAEQDDWELVPTKFDINTLKPFDKVLVRDNNEQFWTCDWFSFHDTKQVYPFACVGHYVSQCIPYEKNEHLLGTPDDCDEYFKTW